MVDELIRSPLSTDYAANREGLKVELGCGSNLREKYQGVDVVDLKLLTERTPSWNGVAPPEYDNYIQHDLLTFPWPFEDDSISAAYSSHFVEHIPHYLPGVSEHATDDGWWHFFAELYRVMEDGGIVEIIHPFSRSDRAFWEPTHTRYIHYQTWFYLSEAQRVDMGSNHCSAEMDFEVLEIQHIHEPVLLEGRSPEVVDFARQFYFNPTDDLFVVLKVNK